MSWLDWGWEDAPAGWQPGDPLPLGFTKQVDAANLETFGQYVYDKAVADAPGGVSPLDAATGTKGVTRLSVAPTSASAPIAAGDNDPRLTDQRVPTDGSVTGAKVAGALKPSGAATAGTEALRALGTAAGQALPGDHASVTNARVPTAHTHPVTDLGSGTPAGGKYLDGAGSWLPLTPQSGHVIEDEGTPLTARSNLNFTGAGVTASDSGGKTVVTIPGASAPDASTSTKGVGRLSVSPASPTAPIAVGTNDPRVAAATATLTWDEDDETYVPSALLADTSVRRVFSGPVPPNTVDGVVMNTRAGWDAFRPTEDPS